MSKVAQTGSSSAPSSRSTGSTLEDPTGKVPALDVEAFERSAAYQELTAGQQSIASTERRPALWLEDVLRRLRKSVGLSDEASDGRWLKHEIVTKASEVFQSTSDILPSEPHLSSSQGGNLVAEFSTPHGPMNMIVSQSSVLLFGVFDGQEHAASVSLANLDVSKLRDSIAGMVPKEGGDSHGAMETRI